MSNGRTHRAIGALAGGGGALARCKDELPLHRLIEVLGGAIGGNVAARLPDLFDPPNHPRHRAMAHGMVPVATGCAVVIRPLTSVQGELRAQAARHADCSAAADSPLERLLHRILELLCRLGAGALAGLLGGYVSHLALDFCTPAGLPFMT